MSQVSQTAFVTGLKNAKRLSPGKKSKKHHSTRRGNISVKKLIDAVKVAKGEDASTLVSSQTEAVAEKVQTVTVGIKAA